MSDLSRPSADEPGSDLSTGRPPREAAPGRLVGRVQGSTTRTESHGHEFGSETVLSFRLLGPDGQSPRDVQMRGRTVSGTVRDGDWVEVSAAERAGRIEIGSLQNLTTGATVQTVGISSTSGRARAIRIVAVIIIVLALLFIVFVALGVFGVFDNGWWPFGGDGGGGGDPLSPGGLGGP